MVIKTMTLSFLIKKKIAEPIALPIITDGKVITM
jgi:hypothetical protein